FLEELVQTAGHNLLGDVQGLALVYDLLGEDFLLLLHALGGDGGPVQVLGVHGGNLHAHVVGIGLEALGSGDVVGGVELHDDANTAASVDVRGDSALIAGKAADFDVLADGEDLLLQKGVHSLLGAGSLAGQQGFHVGGVLLDNGVGAGLDKGL